MVVETSKMTDPIRSLKDKIITQYYRWRIESIQDPYRILLRNNPYRVLFLLGHMRSGSSFFTHILNSNPEIVGYGETHINYSSEIDFKKLIFEVYWRIRDYKMQQKYVLDKVLHDNKFINENFIASEQVYGIFLIREPKRSLASIKDLKPYLSDEEVLDYYINRLATLERYAQIINSKDRSLFFTHQQLIEQTDIVFKALQDFLGTEVGFSEKYEVLRTTGLLGIGDQSENIKAGRIVRTPRKLEFQISEDLLNKAQESFEQCCATLTQYCRIVK